MHLNSLIFSDLIKQLEKSLNLLNELECQNCDFAREIRLQNNFQEYLSNILDGVRDLTYANQVRGGVRGLSKKCQTVFAKYFTSARH